MFLRQITRFLYHFMSIFQNFSKLFNTFTFFCRRQALTTAEILNELELMTASDLPGTSANVFICPPKAPSRSIFYGLVHIFALVHKMSIFLNIWSISPYF